MEYKQKDILNVTISGGCGRVSFELIPLICNGLVFGDKQKLCLNLYDLESQEKRLTGYAMEIEDCAFELISEIKISTNPKDAFMNCDVALLIGGYPHLKGMERKDLLEKNHEIFKDIAINLNEYASRNCKTVVIANPVNSLMTILAQYADKLPKKNFTGLGRLDLNRAKSLTAKLCNTQIDKVTDLIVWGNHSDSQYPDVTFAKINGNPITEHINKSKEWLHSEFVELISTRWKKIVDATGTTSIMGTAEAIKDHIRDWFMGSGNSNITSMAVITDGKSYGLPKGVGFSLPCVTNNFDYKIVDDLVLDEFTKKKLQLNYEEIKEELGLIGFEI